MQRRKVSLLKPTRLISVFILCGVSASAGVYSTVEPYMNIAREVLSNYSSERMQTATSRINGLKNIASDSTKTKYEEKEKLLSDIKRIQADILLYQKKDEAISAQNTDIQSTSNKISTKAVEASISSLEKESIDLSTELQK